VANPLQIGITGGIGSGKTLVSKIFACLGIPVYDADSHAKELMTTDGILVSQIKKEFGDLSYLSDGALNRKYLSEVVFNNQERLDILNKLVHPRVAENYTQWVKRNSDQVYILIIVVHAPEEVRIKRVMHRDGRAEQQVKEIIRKQMSEEEKLKRADFILYNDESSLIIPQVLTVHNQLRMQAS
jgi:dephospho-CoA kinase